MKSIRSAAMFAVMLLLAGCQAVTSGPIVEPAATPLGSNVAASPQPAGTLTQSNTKDALAQQQLARFLPGDTTYPDAVLFRHTEWACSTLQAPMTKEEFAAAVYRYFESLPSVDQPPVEHLLLLILAGGEQYCPKLLRAILNGANSTAAPQESTGDKFLDDLCANTAGVCPLTQEEYVQMVRVISQTCMWLDAGLSRSDIVSEFRKLTADEREVLRYSEVAGFGVNRMCPQHNQRLLQPK